MYKDVNESQPEDDGLLDSDVEGDDVANGRTSEEVRRYDQETLAAEEEVETLLGGGQGKRRTGKEGRRKRRRKRGGKEGEKKVIYDMEHGRRSSGEESSGQSSEVEMQRLGEARVQSRKEKRKSRILPLTAVHLVIIAAFLALLYGAYRATASSRATRKYVGKVLSNGTHTFAPTTLLISLDGFRADFLARDLTPTLNAFIRDGVSPKYMTPSFPSLTFPNHFTLVTGLYPESHGVVGNTFWDPTTQKEFYYTDPERSMQPEWWDAEPLWLTAELAGVRSAIHMWPGSEAHIGKQEPAYVDKFKIDERLDVKVDRILSWLDLPGPGDAGAREDQPRPQLIAAYVPNVDSDGHKYGPNSTYIRSTIKIVDGMLGSIFRGIDERNLTDIVNVVIVSDHGMATTSVNRLIQLEDLIDTSLIEHTDGWPLYGLRPYDDANLQTLHNDLLAASKLPKYKDTFSVYLRDKDMPARYHFTSNPRIAPLWIIPRTGWAIVTKDEFDIVAAKAQNLVYRPRGLHGYDDQDPLMRAIFVARGPAFPHPKGSQVDVFSNIEVYNIVCDSLGIEPKSNNGTLRLPLNVMGLHGDQHVEKVEDFIDDVDESLQGAENLEDMPGFDLPDMGLGNPSRPAVPSPPSPPSTPSPPSRPVVHDGQAEQGSPDNVHDFWEAMRAKLGAIKWWLSEKFGWQAQEAANKQDGKNGTTTEKSG